MVLQDLSAYHLPITYKKSIPLIRSILWYFFASPLVSSYIPGSRWRAFVLRAFGCAAGDNVVFKPRLSVKYPWKLSIGPNSWIGEHVTIDNPFHVYIGFSTCISQHSTLLTGNHDYSSPTFNLRPSIITIGDHVWIGACSIIAPSSTISNGTVIPIGSRFNGSSAPNTIYRIDGSKSTRKTREFPQISFSFIIPIKDPSKHLSLLIDSLLCQTHHQWRAYLILPTHKDANLIRRIFPELDKRFSIHTETSCNPSIYNAMNEGISLLNQDTFVSFLGGDDQLSSKEQLRSVASAISNYSTKHTRQIIFTTSCIYGSTQRISRYSSSFTNLIGFFLGNTPPHQGCFFPASAFTNILYNTKYPIAADLHLFLELASSGYQFISISSSPFILGSFGLSSTNHPQRLQQVFSIYYTRFHCLALVPFLLRYIQRTFNF